jgi:hypothetical protein
LLEKKKKKKKGKNKKALLFIFLQFHQHRTYIGSISRSYIVKRQNLLLLIYYYSTSKGRRRRWRRKGSNILRKGMNDYDERSLFTLCRLAKGEAKTDQQNIIEFKP